MLQTFVPTAVFTHLAEMLRAAEPEREGIVSVTVWGGRETLDLLARHSWLYLQHEKALDGPLLKPLAWQQTKLTRLAMENCDVLFMPGGNYGGKFRPFVLTMAQNQLPFETQERQRYGASLVSVRLELLEKSQLSTFRRAAEIVFLTNITLQIVERRLGPLVKQVSIAHGINPSFRQAPRKQQFASSFHYRGPAAPMASSKGHA